MIKIFPSYSHSNYLLLSKNSRLLDKQPLIIQTKGGCRCGKVKINYNYYLITNGRFLERLRDFVKYNLFKSKIRNKYISHIKNGIKANCK